MNVVSGPVVCGIGRRDAVRVAAFAAGIAKALDAPLTLVRAEAVVELGESRTGLRRSQACLRDLLSHLVQEPQAVTRTVKLGQPATVLAAVAGELQAQLLVIGAGTPARALGAVPWELAMRASCPVLVVPRTPMAKRTDGWQDRHVLCAFDGSDDARAALCVAAGFAERVGAAAFVAHIRPGSLHELGARAQAEQAALIVAPSRALDHWHSTGPVSAPNRSATTAPIPLLLVPPAYRSGAGPPIRVAAAV